MQVTELAPLHAAGHREYLSAAPQYSKSKTYAVVVGYAGGEFWGWAKQPNKRTVQGELVAALGCRITAVSPGPR